MRRAVRVVFRRSHIAREVDDELAFHLEMRTRQLIADGMEPDTARRLALQQFGDVDSVRQSCVTMDQERERAMQRANLFDELRQDVVYALRTLRRNVGFAIVVIVTLALGIGANTAIFTLIDAVLLRTLPVREPSRLVAVGDPSLVGSVSMGTPRGDLISSPLYRELRDRNQLVSGLLASGRTNRLDVFAGATAGEPEHPRGRLVSGNYFSVLGIPALLGRTFGPEEDRAVGASPVVVISHDYWTRRLGADQSALGRTISINGSPYVIIGVTPAEFTGEIVGESTDLWIPLTMQSVIMTNRNWVDTWDTSWLLLLGRLNPGVTLEQARTGFGQLTLQLLENHAQLATDPSALGRARRQTVIVGPGAKGFSRVRSSFTTPLLTLMAGVGLLLLIVCANVANLLLARAVARSREMSVRMALGAGRSRLVRQLLTESAMLALLGAAAGLVVAWWGSRLLLTLAADGSRAIPLDVRLDVPVLAFAVAMSLMAVVLFGLAPALRASRVDLATTMRAHARAVGGRGDVGARGHHIPLGKLLIAGQVALSLLLLVGAGLLVRNLRAVQQADPGLARDRLLILDLDPSGQGYKDDRLRGYVREVAGRLEQLPGVTAVSYSENGIFSGTESQTTLQVEGFTARSHEDTTSYYDHVGPNYVRALGGRLLQGRDITAQDNERAPLVAVVNESFVHFYFPGGNPLGKQLRFDSLSAQIVGVIADAKDHDLKEAPVRRVYVPYLHWLGQPTTAYFVVNTTGDPARLVRDVRREVRAIDPSVAILSVDPLSLLMRQSLREERLVARLATGFGTVALLLAAVGLYGVMTYAITRRTGEIGLRVALGAQRGDVIRMVLIEALRLVGIGIAVGLPLALFAVRLLRSQLHSVGAADPVAIAVALGVLLSSATLAALLPALRASRVAPLVALRQE